MLLKEDIKLTTMYGEKKHGSNNTNSKNFKFDSQNREHASFVTKLSCIRQNLKQEK